MFENDIMDLPLTPPCKTPFISNNWLLKVMFEIDLMQNRLKIRIMLRYILPLTWNYFLIEFVEKGHVSDVIPL